MPTLNRIAFDSRITKQPLLIGFGVTMGEADDDHVNMRLATRLAVPLEGAVRIRNFEPVTIEQTGPELSDLLALGYGIGSNEPDVNPPVIL